MWSVIKYYWTRTLTIALILICSASYRHEIARPYHRKSLWAAVRPFLQVLLPILLAAAMLYTLYDVIRNFEALRELGFHRLAGALDSACPVIRLFANFVSDLIYSFSLLAELPEKVEALRSELKQLQPSRFVTFEQYTPEEEVLADFTIEDPNKVANKDLPVTSVTPTDTLRITVDRWSRYRRWL